MTTTREILADWRDDIGLVPPANRDYVCKRCLGPVSNYEQCYGCFALFVEQGAPVELKDAIVPMTTALSPSRWYSALASYKTFQPEHKRVVASVAYHFLQTHEDKIAAMLGGAVTMITIVPSKRGVDYAQQPLRSALSAVKPINDKLARTLRFIPGSKLGRKQYEPSVFSAAGANVKGERILLIEDTWVTGATSLSAGSRLLELGAESVAIVPIARCVNDSYLPNDHDYRLAIQQPIGKALATPWPRP